ncbi:prepilin-type N-terminal cleavage/methylation domain-containing protein [Iocasia frigidifontis]|uniref:Prepilin-type N-terminal cleavage/methylation domain-containing protein n=1 Tax=Iocasia fonsfrigidae TaxID=2682810 RepID=A0A8A7KBD6_9FIRM|nr:MULTISPECIES: prepilin-type N-terminal cleavage/methylation domain-containing protein [Halanaerobiaceae]AZO95689.1 prepilin-type N-terminal cleavage/methylation domain-containing protein [Halocella sp. SP3-1]QTL98550.1 prepilin-type N-terminal cleavage/methylation domain-containing protein [Iocasia fonsfrigidae]
MFCGEGGFSLLELLLVIAILSLSISFIFPAVNFNSLEMKNYREIIYSTLRKVRQTAIIESEDYLVELLSSKKLAVKKDGESFYNKVIEVGNRFTISCSRNDNQLRFKPLGTADGGTLILSDGVNSLKVVVTGTGFIHKE